MLNIKNRNMSKFIIICAMAIMTVVNIYAQSDSVIFYNGNYVIGEAKTMTRGVLTMETDYSDSDFKIEWEKIKEIYTVTYFLITTSDGERYNGHVRTSEPGKIMIITDSGNEREVNHDEIVWLDDLDSGFWSQLYASVDIGLDLTKANNYRKFSTRATLGYVAKRWSLGGTYNSLLSRQDETEDISRTDGSIDFKYFLPKDWYPLVSVTFLANNEQQIDLRTTGKAGMGKYIIHTNRSFWGFSVGANYNNETYLPSTTVDSVGNEITTTPADRRSWEGFVGTELNLFDIGDLSLSTKLVAYPSFTEAGRWRADFNFDVKYEMPFDDDFYIRLGLTYNFDNKPVEGASKTDYVTAIGLGYQW
jgi:hypothetical protein